MPGFFGGGDRHLAEKSYLYCHRLSLYFIVHTPALHVCTIYLGGLQAGTDIIRSGNV